MAIVYKIIKKHRYAYLQHSYRVGKKVKTRSTYLGRADSNSGWSKAAQEDFARNMATLERENKKLAEWQKKTFGETGEERRERLEQEQRFSQSDFLKETDTPKTDDTMKE